METSADPAPRTKDLKSQIANFEELVGNILSTGEQAAELAYFRRRSSSGRTLEIASRRLSRGLSNSPTTPTTPPPPFKAMGPGSAMGGATAAAMLDQLIALHAAIEENDVETICQLAQEGVDLNARFDENVNPQHAGITALALACATNKVDVVKELIANGADVNTPFAALNTTALMTSSYHGHVEVVRLLLENGADVQMVDLQQSTALGYSFGGSRNLQVVQLLLDHHIDVNKKNMLGMNALLLVAGYGNEALVEKILRAGADPNTVNDFGHTALHLTVVGKRDLLKKLRRLGTAEAVAADRSLNRRNLDVAIQEWARVHRDEVGGTQEDEEALAKAGSIMMSVGHQLEDHPGEDEDEQAVLQKRVQAVWKHRQEKIAKNKDKNKSGIWSLLSCGGGKSSKVDETNAPGAKPYAPTQQVQDPVAVKAQAPQDEYGRLSKSFARILRLLIDARCEIDRAEKTFGMTALDLAILNGDVESSAVLTSAGADPNHFLKMLSLKELYQAIVSGQRKEVKELLTYDEDLDVNQIFSRFNVDTQSSDEGMTPVTLASRQEDIEIVKMLLKKGANVNLMGPSGRFPLAEACAKGNIKLVTLLLQNNASPEKTCPALQDATPLTIASNHQHHKLVEFLLKKGAKVDQPMSDGRIALLKAFEARDMDMVDILLRQSTQENFSDMQGLTAHLAAEYQSKDRDTEAILSKVSDAVRVFQEEEEAIQAASVNVSDDNNQLPMAEHALTPGPAPAPAQYVTPPREAPPQARGRLDVSPQQVQQRVEDMVEEVVERPRVAQQQRAAPLVAHSQPPQAARPARQPSSPTRPTQPAPPAPQPQPPVELEPTVETEKIVTRTVVTRVVTMTGDDVTNVKEVTEVADPIVETFTRGPPPPVPATSPPADPQPQELSVTVPNESSSPKVVMRRVEEDLRPMDENSSSESEYETDEEEEEEDDDEEEEEEGEEEESSPDASTAATQRIVVTRVVRHAPVVTAEMVHFEEETDIDAREDGVSPSPHETSDVNENVVKEEEPASPNANTVTPPPVPVTSPPKESNETTV